MKRNKRNKRKNAFSALCAPRSAIIASPFKGCGIIALRRTAGERAERFVVRARFRKGLPVPAAALAEDEWLDRFVRGSAASTRINSLPASPRAARAGHPRGASKESFFGVERGLGFREANFPLDQSLSTLFYIP